MNKEKGHSRINGTSDELYEGSCVWTIFSGKKSNKMFVLDLQVNLNSVSGRNTRDC